MLDKLDAALRFQQEALNLRAQRQEILAANIANADTPGFQARDIDFSSQLTRAIEQGRVNGSGVELKPPLAAIFLPRVFSRLNWICSTASPINHRWMETPSIWTASVRNSLITACAIKPI